MLYRDYSRKSGDWIPNRDGGRENWEAVEFLRRMNTAVYGSQPGVFTIAEESTLLARRVPARRSGRAWLRFKWNMGFMHDTLQYMAREPVHRVHHHDEITFGLLYALQREFRAAPQP